MQSFLASIAPESSTLIDWLRSVGLDRCPLPPGACFLAYDSNSPKFLSELQGWSTPARAIHWLLYYPPANVEELRRAVNDIARKRPRSPSVWQPLLERIAGNCRSAMMPWVIDLCFAAYAYLATDPAQLSAIKESVSAATKTNLPSTIDHSWVSGEFIDWMGLIAHEYDNVGYAVWDTCISGGEPPLVVTTGFRRELPLIGSYAQPAVWIDRSDLRVGRYEIFLKDPEDYWVYRPKSRAEFHDMCRSSSGGHATLTIVFPNETSIENVKGMLQAISDARIRQRLDLECYLSRWRVPAWVYYVGGSYPHSYTLFLSKDTILTRSIQSSHEENDARTLPI